ncbi:MAG: hypothetical protein H0U67_11185 [Gemmatimonadetes bacterium]|nr:hypothetical protein [Gemmatimonadota bacterium]
MTAYAVTSGTRRKLARASVARDGSWGPLSIFAQAGGSLALRLEGVGLIPAEETLGMPAPRSFVRADFEPAAGVLVPLSVTAADEGTPVHPARVRAWWHGEGGWEFADARTAAGGGASVTVPPGEIFFRVQASGYEIANLAGMAIDSTPESPVRIQLSRAGVLVGRVMSSSGPVPDFKVRFWGSDGGGSGSLAVADSADGSFRAESVPLGGVMVYAQRDGFPPSELQRVEIRSGQQVEIELLLPDARQGRGRIVDAFTGRPLPGARARTWVRDRQTWIEATGMDGVADEDGEFVLDGLAPGLNHLELQAEGYALANGEVAVMGEGVVELGAWALAPAQDLVVRLTGPAASSPGQLTARLRRTLPAREQRFDANGEAVFTAFPAGQTTVQVITPTGMVVEESAYLVAGQPWVIEIAVEEQGEDALDVEVIGLEHLEPGLVLHSFTSLGQDRQRERLLFVEGGRASVPGPFGEEVILRLLEDEAKLIVVRHLRRSDLRGSRLVLEIDHEARRFQIVDRQQQPLQDVQVILQILGDRSGWSCAEITDSAGHVDFLLPPGREFQLHFRFPGGGGIGDRRVELPADPNEVMVVVLQTNAELEVRYEDGGIPIQGIRGLLLAPSGYRFVFLDRSDLSGWSRSGPIPAGRYTLDALEPGYWPVVLPVEVREGPNLHVIPIRRLGAVVIHVRSFGMPKVPAAAVYLVNAESGESVEQWIAEGKLVSPKGGMVTDANGELRVVAIPNGTYRYRVVAQDGQTAEGELLVPPHSEGKVKILFP